MCEDGANRLIVSVVDKFGQIAFPERVWLVGYASRILAVAQRGIEKPYRSVALGPDASMMPESSALRARLHIRLHDLQAVALGPLADGTKMADCNAGNEPLLGLQRALGKAVGKMGEAATGVSSSIAVLQNLAVRELVHVFSDEVGLPQRNSAARRQKPTGACEWPLRLRG